MSEGRVQDARSQGADLKRRLVAAIADEQRLYHRYNEATREAARWAARADLAHAHGSEELSRAALGRSRRHESEAVRYHQEYLEQKAHVERMKTRLMELESGIVGGGRLGVQAVGFPGLEPNLSRTRRFEERAREERARLAAQAELERDELAEKLTALEREDRLERELAELKRKLLGEEDVSHT